MRMPLFFEPNRGQSDARVHYVARGPGYGMYFTGDETVLSLRSSVKGGDRAVVHMVLHGADRAARVRGEELQPVRSQYFRGADPQHWARDVPRYAKLRYENVYPGVDLVYYGNQAQLEYDFIVAPRQDPNRIAIDFAGVRALSLDRNGNLRLRTAAGDLVQHKPVIYQTIAGQRHSVAGGYRLLADNRVGFQVGAYDHAEPLVVDPILAYSSYLGGSGADYVSSIATDAAGNVYVTGNTESFDFPASIVLSQGLEANGGDIFVTKFNPHTDAVLYSAYIGGSAADFPMTIAVDGAGHAYVGGSTASTDFPIRNALQPLHGADGGLQDAFVLKLAADGKSLLYSTYVGGSGEDSGNSLAVDASGAAYIGGSTGSIDLPTTLSALQTTLKGNDDGFVAKLDPSGTGLVYATYLGGSYGDLVYGITVDAHGNAYAVGKTFSADFPRTVAAVLNGSSDAFASKLATDGSSLIYSTTFGGGGDERAMAVATYEIPSSPTPQKFAYVVGRTNSGNFPVFSGAQSTPGGGWDGFVTQLGDTGQISTSTYLGGSGDEDLREIRMRGSLPTVVGSSNSSDYPVSGAVQPGSGGGYDAVYTQLYTSLQAIRVSSYVGATGDDQGWAIATYGRGNIFIAGQTQSTDLPVLHAYQAVPPGGADGFIARIGGRGMLGSYTHDFDADGSGDVLWRNPATGANTLWPSADQAHKRAIATMTKNWKAVAIGDFNCDQRSDILWRDPVTGANRIWMGADSATVQATATFGSTWDVAGVGDFRDNSGCRKDILWHNRSTGANKLWISARAGSTITLGTVTDLDWHIAGIGDFDDDGDSDVLWHHMRTGKNAIWRSGNSASQTPVPAVTDLAWSVAGVGDFLDDGPADILWHNSKTGASAVWRSGRKETQQPVNSVGLDWKVGAVADFNGDGRSDIFWRNAKTGANAIWYSANVRQQPVLPAVATSWSPVP